MSDFINPKRVFINKVEYIKDLVNVNLQKDLHDDEEVCQFCYGTGLVVSDNIYGLSDDPNHTHGRFPYKHQSISFCQHCYNGVIHRCSLCGDIMPRGYLKHNCNQQQAIDLQKSIEAEKKLFEKAIEYPAFSINDFGMLYDEAYYYNEGYFSDWEEYLDWWNEYHSGDTRPKYVWGTYRVQMKIDADSIVETATEDMYEDARSSISQQAVNELQEYLDKWCENCGISDTFAQDTKCKVLIPWRD